MIKSKFIKITNLLNQHSNYKDNIMSNTNNATNQIGLEKADMSEVIDKLNDLLFLLLLKLI